MTPEEIGKLTDSDNCVKPRSRLIPGLLALNAFLLAAIVVMWWMI
jgi:hypothetical protein